MSRRATTLIEVLIGAVVLGIFVIPLFTSLLQTHRGTVLLQEDVQAVLLGLELLDQLKIVPLKFIEGMPEVKVGAGGQPLLDHFRRSPLCAAIRANPKELAKVEALLTLRLSPLPAGYERSVTLGAREGFFARVTVRVKFRQGDPPGATRERIRTVSGVLVGGA